MSDLTESRQGFGLSVPVIRGAPQRQRLLVLLNCLSACLDRAVPEKSLAFGQQLLGGNGGQVSRLGSPPLIDVELVRTRRGACAGTHRQLIVPFPRRYERQSNPLRKTDGAIDFNQFVIRGMPKRQDQFAGAPFDHHPHELIIRNRQEVGVDFSAGDLAFDLRARQQRALFLRLTAPRQARGLHGNRQEHDQGQRPNRSDIELSVVKRRVIHLRAPVEEVFCNEARQTRRWPLSVSIV